MEKYICYDGVEHDITYHDTIDQAIIQLDEYIQNSLENGEWMEGIENSFIAEIKYKVQKNEINVDSMNEVVCYAMDVEEVTE